MGLVVDKPTLNFFGADLPENHFFSTAALSDACGGVSVSR